MFMKNPLKHNLRLIPKNKKGTSWMVAIQLTSIMNSLSSREFRRSIIRTLSGLKAFRPLLL